MKPILKSQARTWLYHHIHMSSLACQGGQALVLGIALMAVLCLILLSMFGSGRLVAEKSRQTNSIDAAAYSGALIQARALNMQSYINLAQIGHQMAMAHLVTLGSWAHFTSTEAKQLMSANPPAFIIGMMFGGQHQNAYLASTRAAQIQSISLPSNQLAQQYAQHDQVAEEVLLRVSAAIRDSMTESRNKAIQAVLESNYPEHNVVHEDKVQVKNTAAGITDFKKMTALDSSKGKTLYWSINEKDQSKLTAIFKPSGNYRSLIAQVANVYKFLDQRNHTRSNPWLVSSRCPHLRHQLRRTGATILNDQGLWQSIDTQSYHALRSNRWIGCYYREYPMGWGWIPGQSDSVPRDIQYTENPPDNFSQQDFWRWVQSATEWNLLAGKQNPLANSRAIVARQKWQGGGVKPYVDINQRSGLKKYQFELRTSLQSIQGQNLQVKALAETFFVRYRPRADGKKELSNLWHPYWQARLAAGEAE